MSYDSICYFIWQRILLFLSITYVGIILYVIAVWFVLLSHKLLYFHDGQWVSFVLRKGSVKKMHPENLTAMVLIECLITLAVCFILMFVFTVCLLFVWYNGECLLLDAIHNLHAKTNRALICIFCILNEWYKCHQANNCTVSRISMMQGLVWPY